MKHTKEVRRCRAHISALPYVRMSSAGFRAMFFRAIGKTDDYGDEMVG